MNARASDFSARHVCCRAHKRNSALGASSQAAAASETLPPNRWEYSSPCGQGLNFENTWLNDFDESNGTWDGSNFLTLFLGGRHA